jgi:hypothetical protein
MKLSNTNSYGEIILVNIIALITVYLSALIFGDVKDLVGQPVWLQIGAITVSYLLFGFRVFAGVFIGGILSGYFIWNWGGSPLNWLQAFAGSMAPLLAIQCMKVFKLSNFYGDDKLVFEHVIFLAILAGIFNTGLKLIVNTSIRNNILYPELPAREIDVLSFIQSYLFGDIVGGIAFIFIVTMVVTPIIRVLRIRRG